MKSNKWIFLLHIMMASFLMSCAKINFTQNGAIELLSMGSGWAHESYALSDIKAEMDILIISDNSGSMKEEQARMAERFRDFASALESVDWRLAVTTTDLSSRDGLNGAKGGFVDIVGLSTHRKVLFPADENVETLFMETIKSCGTGGSSHEEPLGAIVKAMDLRDSWNKGFFREDGHLAVIILTDEDESGSTTGADVMKHFDSHFQGRKNISVHAIIEGDGTESQVAALARDTHGVVGDINESNYANILSEISQRVSQQAHSLPLHYTTSFIEDSVKVTTIPEQEVQWSLVGDYVVINNMLLPGTVINIDYIRE